MFSGLHNNSVLNTFGSYINKSYNVLSSILCNCWTPTIVFFGGGIYLLIYASQEKANLEKVFAELCHNGQCPPDQVFPNGDCIAERTACLATGGLNLTIDAAEALAAQCLEICRKLDLAGYIYKVTLGGMVCLVGGCISGCVATIKCCKPREEGNGASIEMSPPGLNT